MLREVLFAGGGVGERLGSAVKYPLKSGVTSVQKNTEATKGAGGGRATRMCILLIELLVGEKTDSWVAPLSLGPGEYLQVQLLPEKTHLC